MTPEELKQKDLNELRAALVKHTCGAHIIAEAICNTLNADQVVQLIVELKRNLRVPVDLRTEEIPGHGLYKPRQHDPNPKVAKLEAKSEH